MSSPGNDDGGDDAALSRQKRIIDSFDHVLNLPEDARMPWLESQFPGDPAAIAAVLSLLRADGLAPSVMPTEIPQGEGLPLLVVPARIGPYRLADMLGAGGMGEVWRGVRDDGLFDQDVAIKLMRPSRYAAESLRYFDTERRALARLNHRHIARLTDGGVTEEGLPWFIMELVRGRPLQEAAASGLPRDAALALMIAVAEAVQYAHQQLVVHADIKPSNILVGDDGEPVLVDFGIASLAALGEGEKGLFPSTPAFASPQRREGLPPTPADDIWSLGLLLHGLLTGAWPETTPAFPLPATGDAAIDGIIAQACAADPVARYATAQGLADDLRALRDHRPTQLQASDWRMVSRLFVRRHPRAMLAAAIGVTATFTALVVTTSLYLRVEHEKQVAQRRFDDVRTLANDMIGDFHDELVTLPGAAVLNARTTAEGERYLERLSRDAALSDDVLRDIAVGYGRIGHAQATTSINATGDVAAGEKALAESERRLRELVARHSGDDTLKTELARTLTWRGGVILNGHSDAKGARAVTEEALGLYDQVFARHPGDVEAGYGRWNAAIGLADILSTTGDYAGVKRVMEDAQRRTAGLATPPAMVAQRALLAAATENTLGDAIYYLGDPHAGIAHYVKALAFVENARSDGISDVRLDLRQAYYEYQLSSSFADIGPADQALKWADRSLATARAVARFDDSIVTEHTLSMAQIQRAAVLAGAGRAQEAVADIESAVDHRRAVAARHPEDSLARISLAVGLRVASSYYNSAGNPKQACASARESLSIFDDLSRHGGLPAANQRLDVPELAQILASCKP